MKGFLFAGGVLIALDVFLQPNAAGKLATGGNVFTAWLHRFLSADVPGIPNLTKLSGGDLGGGKSEEAPGAPGLVPVPGIVGPVATPRPVISV